MQIFCKCHVIGEACCIERDDINSARGRVLLLCKGDTIVEHTSQNLKRFDIIVLTSDGVSCKIFTRIQNAMKIAISNQKEI